MAGATNRALRAAGLPKPTVKTLRAEAGAGLSLRSAIQIAVARGLAVPDKAHAFLAKREGKAGLVRQTETATARRATLALRGTQALGKTLSAVRKTQLAEEMKTQKGVGARLQRLHAAGDYAGMVKVMGASRDSGVVRLRNPYFKTALTHAIALHRQDDLSRRQIEIANDGIRTAIANFRRFGDDLPR